MSFLTDLYLKKGLNLRQISEELDCSNATVRKKLIEAGVEIKQRTYHENGLLLNKVKEMRSRGLSYESIACFFNLWAIETRTGKCKWHAKTIRDIILKGFNF